MTWREGVGLGLFPLGLVLGMPLGWRKEAWGGMLTVILLFAFYRWQWHATGRLPRGPLLLRFSRPGFIFCWQQPCIPGNRNGSMP